MNPRLYAEQITRRLQTPVIRITLRLGLTVICLAYLLWFAKDSIGALQGVWQQINILYLLIAFPVFLIATLIAGSFWSIITKSLGVTTNPLTSIKIYFLTLAARRLPGSVLHIVGRVTIYKRLGESMRVVTLASGLEYFFIMWSGLFISIFFMVVLFQWNAMRYWYLIILLGLLTAAFHPKILRAIIKKIVHDDSLVYFTSWQIIQWCCAYLFLWILGGFLFIIVACAVYPTAYHFWLPICAAWCLGGVSGMIVTVMPAGLGLTELTMSVILGQYIPPAIAVVIALLARILFTIFDLTLSVIIFLLEKRNTPNGLL